MAERRPRAPSGTRLAGKVVIVTGAAQGSGYGAAEAMAEDGATVVLVGRTEWKLEHAAARLRDLGATIVVAAGDVTDHEAMAAMVATVVDHFGRVDGLVCAAHTASTRAGLLLDIPLEAVEELWQSGPVATLVLMRLCHPYMKEAGGGSIVTFASGSLRAPRHWGVYAGCKAAILAMSRAAAVEWGPDGIRVNTVSPFVRSPTLESDMSPEMQERVAARNPLGRIGAPEEIGRVVSFLVSDDASYVTGNLMTLDGGSWHTR